MKKFMLFMLLFIAGISVLRWIQNPIPVDTVEASHDSRIQEPVAPVALKVRSETEASAVAVVPDESESGDIAVKVFGAAEYTKRVLEGPNRGRKIFRLQAKDSRSLSDGRLELIDLWAIAYDVETDEELLRVEAESGLADIVNPLEHEIVLRDVELVLLRNAPVVPLTMRTENLLFDPNDNLLRTEDRVEIQGQGLTAAGTGFEFAIVDGILRFEREGFAEVEIDSGPTSTLTSVGGLEIRRTEGSEGPITLDAEEEATLSIEGETPILLKSDHLRITGREKNKESDLLGFESVVAEGAVTLSLGGNQFSADRAQVELVEDQDKFRAELTGSPHGQFSFVGGLTADKGIEDATKPFNVEFSGRGPLVVNRSEETQFELAGPAQLKWSDAILQAEQRVSGTFGPTVDEAEFTAFGSVEIRQETRLLSTPEFRLRHERGSDRASLLTASASGPARMSGEVDNEHSFVLTTDNQIDFALEGVEWRVPRANGIALTVEGPRGFVAKAREVIGFAPDPLTLRAIGDVSVVSSWGNVEGHSLSLTGLDAMTIDGLPDQLAHFKSDRGEWFALHVRRLGSSMIAVGVDRAIFSDAYGTYELGCGRMVVEEVDEPGSGGGTLRDKGFRFSASDSVKGRAIYPGDSFEIESGRLRGEWIEHMRDTQLLYSESVLVAQEDVHSKFSRASKQFDLRSDLLTATRTNRGSEVLTSDALVAEGNVIVETVSDARFHGTGDRLEIDKFGRGELIATQGNRITASGELAGGKFPFAMTSDRLIFSDTFLDASYPEIEFLTTEQSPQHPEGINTRASAKRLIARGEENSPSGEVSLTGDVRMDGVVENGNAFVLLADEAQIGIRFAGGGGLLASVSASGQVEFDLENVMHAEGDEFLGKSAQKRFRVAGSPARVFYGETNIETAWMEYDHLIHAISTARGALFLPTTNDQ